MLKLGLINQGNSNSLSISQRIPRELEYRILASDSFSLTLSYNHVYHFTFSSVLNYRVYILEDIEMLQSFSERKMYPVLSYAKLSTCSHIWCIDS